MTNRAVCDALQRENLSLFLVSVFATLHLGAPPLQLAWYLRAMCHALQTTSEGQGRRLVISVPPRHLKSITASVAWVAWLLGHNPGLKIIVATYSAELAREHADACRAIMTSAWYLALFPSARMSPGSNRQLDFKTTAGGGRRSISVGGSTTGMGADLIILDDCMKADDIGSEAARVALKTWYTTVLLSRLNSKKGGNILSIQQRLGEDDLTAFLLDAGYEQLCLPAIAEREEVVAIGPGRGYRRVVGDLLDPKREDAPTLAGLRRELGAAVFGAQYQQNPVAPEGNIVRIEKFPRYAYPMSRDQFQKIVQSWDTGMSALATSDWSVGTIWGYRDHRWYLLDVFRQQLDYPDLRDAVVRLWRMWKPDKVLIEDAGSGKSLYQEIWKQKKLLKPLMILPQGSKEERLRGQLGQIEDGRIVLPDAAPWLDKYLAELRAAPNGRNDDQVDSTTQALAWMMTRDAWINTPIDPETGRRLFIVRRATLRRRQG